MNQHQHTRTWFLIFRKWFPHGISGITLLQISSSPQFENHCRESIEHESRHAQTRARQKHSCFTLARARLEPTAFWRARLLIPGSVSKSGIASPSSRHWKPADSQKRIVLTVSSFLTFRLLCVYTVVPLWVRSNWLKRSSYSHFWFFKMFLLCSWQTNLLTWTSLSTPHTCFLFYVLDGKLLQSRINA